MSGAVPKQPTRAELLRTVVYLQACLRAEEDKYSKTLEAKHEELAERVDHLSRMVDALDRAVEEIQSDVADLQAQGE